MGLSLHNTLTRTKDDFVPIDPLHVRMYVCGPTVYDFAHIGNARPLIVFDVLFRLLRHLYGPDHVTYVRNITDVDDKINARAPRFRRRSAGSLSLNDAIREVTERPRRSSARMSPPLAAWSPLRAAGHRLHQPRRRRRDMIALIAQLIERGHAYEADGDVSSTCPRCPTTASCPTARLDEHGGRRPRRGRARQARPGGFRPLEAVEPRRARLAVARGARAVRAGISNARRWRRLLGETLRHPRRRARPHLPAPRERDRPVALRPRQGGDGELLAPQRLPPGRGGEDVEEPRQFHHHPGRPRTTGRARWCASPC